MNIALLGKGKTGGKVVELFEERRQSTPEYEELFVFDTTHPPTVEALRQADVVISFLPGEAFAEMIPLLLEAQRPVVTGSTGLEWPEGIDQQLRTHGVSWIRAHNFALGMNLVHQLIETLSRAPKLFDDFQFSMHEIHHTQKRDAPSGTALSWKEWLGLPVNITSERTGDVVGLHRLSLETPTEKITVEHQALDRKIFADGALWAANILLQSKKQDKNFIPAGLVDFQSLALKVLLSK